ncbi:MAG: hypothetical protein PHQ22_10135 [Sulfuricurvum sp.]|nr:hypothetical protein [Sulfuricurvum sp.]MDD5387538.1 hypothetical protein [Sulfuricurvum sp.]
MSQTELFVSAFEILSQNIRKHSSISAQFRNILLASLRMESDSVPVVTGLFKLNIQFLQTLIRVATKDLKAKTDAESVQHDKMLYKEFKRLKRYQLIHKQSVSYLPRNLVLVSINPNHNSLLTNAYSKLDLVDTAQKAFETHCMVERPGANVLLQIYIYLRLFHVKPLVQSVMGKLHWKDLIVTPDKKALLVIYEDSFFTSGADGHGLRPYKLFLLDEFVSGLFVKINDYYQNKAQLIFQDVRLFEEQMANSREKSSIKGVTIHELRQLVKIRYMYINSPLALTLRVGVVQPVQLSLADVEALYPGTVPLKLMDEEKMRVEWALCRPETEQEETDWQAISFDIYDCQDFLALLRHHDNMPPRESISKAVAELNQASKGNDSPHLGMIYEYLLYLLVLLQKKRIRLSTLKSYVWLLNKHLFMMIADFYDIKEHEIHRLSNRLDSKEYKKTSVSKIKSQINRFFRYFAKKGFVIDVAGSFYPKSMVFSHEINPIYDNIEENYKSWKSIGKIGKHHKHYLLQLKVLVLLGFYLGLRLKEARSILLRDIYIYGNHLYADINTKGIKKIGFKFKSYSAKRRVDAIIEDQGHLEMIEIWMKSRADMTNKSQHAFLELSAFNGFLNKAINEQVFDYINSSIKSVTKRYCTYHSLRHSFVTYQCHDHFQSGSPYPYFFLELSDKVGHRTPDVTVNSYLHGGVLFLKYGSLHNSEKIAR